MLEALRKGAGSWVAKILFGILVISFAFWGIADVFRGFGGNTLATVGSTTLTPQSYESLFTRELNALSESVRRQITPQEGRALGLDQRVFAGLLIDTHIHDLGLGISHDALLARIQSSEAFKGFSGKFDPAKFQEVLANNGLSEQGFLETERRQALREQALSGLAGETTTPQVMLDAVNRYQNEKRVLDFFVLDEKQVAEPAAPDEAALKAFYDRRKKDYTVPELRRIGLLEADPQALKSGFTVPDAEIETYYKSHEASFDTPEKRRILQIVFPDKPAAEKALAELAAGKDFLDVAKAAGRSDTDVDRGTVTKDQLVDQAVADAAFSLAKDTNSAVIEGALSVSIVRVKEIEPAIKKTLADVKDEIKDRLALDKANAALQDLYDKVEDERAKGSTLKDAAAVVGLKYTEVPGVSLAGTDADGKTVPAAAIAANLLKTVFDADVGVETEPLERAQGGYVWVDVLEVIAPRERALDEVKPKLTEAYIAAEKAKALSAKAEDLVKRANAGEDLAKLATEVAATVKTSEPLTRTSGSPDLPETALPLAFSLAKGSASWTPGTEGTTRLIFRLKDIVAPEALTEETRKNLAAKLAQLRSTDVASEYVAGLRTQYGLTINQDLYNRLYGTKE
ncbi:MAG: peptidyl-prolyl cis-trans isomerase [Hyphomicrobiaceae bacterium]